MAVELNPLNWPACSTGWLIRTKIFTYLLTYLIPVTSLSCADVFFHLILPIKNVLSLVSVLLSGKLSKSSSSQSATDTVRDGSKWSADVSSDMCVYFVAFCFSTDTQYIECPIFTRDSRNCWTRINYRSSVRLFVMTRYRIKTLGFYHVIA